MAEEMVVQIQRSDGPIVGLSNPLPATITTGSNTPLAQTLQANGTATTPAAGSAVATITTPPAGTYLVRMAYQLSGTAETLVKNLRLSGATLNVDFETIGSSLNLVTVDAVIMDGVASLVAKAVATATTGAVYTVTLLATRIA